MKKQAVLLKKATLESLMALPKRFPTYSQIVDGYNKYLRDNRELAQKIAREEIRYDLISYLWNNFLLVESEEGSFMIRRHEDIILEIYKIPMEVIARLVRDYTELISWNDEDRR